MWCLKPEMPSAGTRCFKVFYIHKFRATIGEKQLIFPSEKVLLEGSEGSLSSSMVGQVHEGLSGDAARRLPFVTRVVYINEGAACRQSPRTEHKPWPR